MAIASDDAFHLGVLSSRIHIQTGRCSAGLARLKTAHAIINRGLFDPFPFPDPTPAQRTAIAELAEELDATRKTALAEVPGLTMTELYNLRDKLRSGAAMTPADRDRATQARAGIVNRLHEQLDAAVAAAYGWPADLPPSEIVARLVALNAERAAEEKAGHVRWLRPGLSDSALRIEGPEEGRFRIKSGMTSKRQRLRAPGARTLPDPRPAPGQASPE